MERLFRCKAGRCDRRGDSKWVDAKPERGAISIDRGEDGLIHFTYKNLQSDNTVDDLILFPGDAEFSALSASSLIDSSSSPPPRVYTLRFQSSNRVHFYWMQDPDEGRGDSEKARTINGLIGGDEAGEDDDEDTRMEDSAPPASASTTTQPRMDQPSSQVSSEQLNRLREAMLSVIDVEKTNERRSFRDGDIAPPLALRDLLDPSFLRPYLESCDPSAKEALFQFLPSEVPHDEETLLRVCTSAEFRRTLSVLDIALNNAPGALAPLTTSLGLNVAAADGVEEFVKEIAQQGEKLGGSGSSNRMDTD